MGFININKYTTTTRQNPRLRGSKTSSPQARSLLFCSCLITSPGASHLAIRGSTTWAELQKGKEGANTEHRTHVAPTQILSESEWDLLPSRFTPTWNFFWCEGAYSKHKTSTVRSEERRVGKECRSRLSP